MAQTQFQRPPTLQKFLPHRPFLGLVIVMIITTVATRLLAKEPKDTACQQLVQHKHRHD